MIICFDPQTPGASRPARLAFGLTGRRAVALAARLRRAELALFIEAGEVA